MGITYEKLNGLRAILGWKEIDLRLLKDKKEAWLQDPFTEQGRKGRSSMNKSYSKNKRVIFFKNSHRKEDLGIVVCKIKPYYCYTQIFHIAVIQYSPVKFRRWLKICLMNSIKGLLYAKNKTKLSFYLPTFSSKSFSM